MTQFTYPTTNAPLVNEGQALANAEQQTQILFAAQQTALGSNTPIGMIAAGLAEVLAGSLTQGVTVPIPSVGAGARTQVNVDFFPPLVGPSFDALVMVTDSTNAGGVAGLRFERVVSLTAQSCVVQIINDGAGASVGTVTVMGASYTPSLAGNPATDAKIATLKAALTGNVQLFDKRYNQVTTAGRLVRWDAVLGNSPPIVGRVANLPVTLGNGNPIVTDGLATAGATVASALYDLSLAHSLVVISRCIKAPTRTTAQFEVMAETTTGAGITATYPEGNGLLGSAGFRLNGGAITMIGPSAKTLDGTISCLAFTRTAGTAGQFGALPGPMTAVTVVQPPSANGQLCIGGDLTFTQFCQAEVHAVLFADHVLSGAELTAIYAYALSAHGEQTQATGNVFVCDGDSMTYGNGLTDLTANYPTQLILNALLASRAFGAVNLGTVAKQLTGGGGMIATAPTMVDPILRASGKNQYCHIWGGTNDYVAGRTGAQVAADLLTYAQARVAAGWKPKNVIVFTTIARTDTVIDTQRNIGNPIVRANAASVGYTVCDIAADPIIGVNLAPTVNPTYFAGDGVHLSALGVQQLLRTLMPVTMNTVV